MFLYLAVDTLLSRLNSLSGCQSDSLPVLGSAHSIEGLLSKKAAPYLKAGGGKTGQERLFEVSSPV